MNISFNDFLKDKKYQPLIKQLREKYGDDIPEEIKTLTLEIGARSVERTEQTVRWVNLMLDLTKSILSEKVSATYHPLFWIYLHGILTEMIFDFNGYKAIGGIPNFLSPIYKTLLAIKSVFTKEELKFIKFMRHSHVHLHLDYYWSSTKVDNGEIVKIKTPEEFDARDNAANIIAKYGGQQILVAVNFSERIIGYIEKLKEQVIVANSTV